MSSHNVANPNNVLELRETQATVRTLGLDVITPEIRRVDDIAAAIESLKGQAEALYVQTDPQFTTGRVRINELALAARLPTSYSAREYVVAADLPVEQPTNCEMVINLKTAKALGLAVPPTLLARADGVIE